MLFRSWGEFEIGKREKRPGDNNTTLDSYQISIEEEEEKKEEEEEEKTENIQYKYTSKFWVENEEEIHSNFKL